MLAPLLRDVRAGIAIGAAYALLCSVLLAIALGLGARDLPASPRTFLVWYWTAGLASGAIWGALRPFRSAVAGYLASGAAAGVGITTPLALLVAMEEGGLAGWELVLILGAAGVPGGLTIGYLAWRRRSVIPPPN